MAGLLIAQKVARPAHVEVMAGQLEACAQTIERLEDTQAAVCRLGDDLVPWRGEISMQSEEDWQKWFANYEQFILHYAQLAQEEGIEMLCIGTELHRTSKINGF